MPEVPAAPEATGDPGVQSPPQPASSPELDSPGQLPVPASEAAGPPADNSAEEYQRAIRELRASHFQMRMSAVDNSFAVDFYSDVRASDYVETFRKGYCRRSLTWRRVPVTNARRATGSRVASTASSWC
jgi:hypothetical protein